MIPIMVRGWADALWRPILSRARIGVRLAVCSSAILLWTVFALMAASEHSDMWQKAYLKASSASRIISLDLARNLEVLELTLRGVEDGLSFPGIAALPLKERNQVLYARAASAEFFSNLFVMNERGDLVVDSRELAPRPLNYADREYFKFLRDHAGTGMYINRPVFSKVGDAWTMPVAIRLTYPDGSFRGVAVGGLRLAYILRLFQQSNTDTTDTISLIRDDGAVMARWPTAPDVITAEIESAAPLTHPRQDGEIWTEGPSKIAGVKRILVGTKIGKFPLSVAVGISTSDVFSGWYRRVVPIGLVLLVLTGTVVALTFGLVRELDRRTRSEALLGEAAERESAIFRNSSDSLFVVRVEDGPDGAAFVCDTLSPAFEQLTGMRVEDVVGRRPDECLPADVAAAMVAHFRLCVAERSTIPWHATYVLPCGKRDFEGFVTAVPPPANGKVVRLVGAMRDVTVRREMEAALHHAQKLESIGRLSAGVAHDFNNILQSVVSGLELVLDEVPKGTQAHEFAGVAIKSAMRGSSLTHHLLSYARKQVLQPRAVVLEPFLAELQTLLARTLEPHITVRATADTSSTVWADPGQLQTALVNLAINAAHAMPHGGVLTLSARSLRDDAQAPVAITVTDDGTGMDATTLARAVEPFFTTKGPEGSGLGLSMVQGFAEQSSGEFHIRSNPGRGTTVELRLPSAAADTPSLQPGLPQEPRTPNLILLVDDSIDVLQTTGRILRKAGFKVTSADSGEKALALLAKGECFDVVVSDYAMPGLNGAELIARAQIIQPGLQAMLITGYADTSYADTLPTGTPVLHKPFQRIDLINALARIIHEGEVQARVVVS